MKGQKSRIIFILALLSLAGIGTILTVSYFRKQTPPAGPVPSLQNILGDTIENNIAPTSVAGINRIVQDSLTNTREVLSEKLMQVEKTILEEVNKEVQNLTQSQVTALKVQICKDWGVIETTPTPNP